ncbi:hypothetical protein V495_04096 [Pseudogymnoascus sp. VKM F-4514 (FW-929)]|nr:hypothetical protein V495_04096 [Pseudogymnoascus sp. VKM F-4514 (FW-929)]KFY64428.1 hypothetical protein V497_01714 [Pseudogymnoascus sp. VKM F-4516 (FW-969)]
MRPPALPVSSLRTWAKFNGISFKDISVEKNKEYGGYGVISTTTLPDSAGDEGSNLTVLNVPNDLILSAETIAEHAKIDKHFGQVLEAVGGNSLRGDVMLFLLMQVTRASSDPSVRFSVSGPWTEYVKMLPEYISLPTAWHDDQIKLLNGTSLEKAVAAKVTALVREFETLRENTTEIPWCHNAWWDKEHLEFKDWILIDSWYRSRSLELPLSGEAMVPFLDMANHSANANAHYQQGSDDEVLLQVKPEQRVEKGEELTIDYGSTKSAAEMLFSYGFIDDLSSAHSLVLHISPSPDDPLAKAKAKIHGKPPTLRISVTDDSVVLICPFIYLMCVNEDDGLDFKVLLENDGTFGQMRAFWKSTDITDSISNFKDIITADPLADVFLLRAKVLLRYIVDDQLERLSESEHTANELDPNQESLSVGDKGIPEAASKLRVIEAGLLSKSLELLEAEINTLSSSPIVQEYLGNSQAQDAPGAGDNSESEDFS